MRPIHQPRPGFFAMRLVKGGAEVGAAIWRGCRCSVNGPEHHHWRETCDRYPPLQAVINGQEAPVQRVWESGREIDEAEYEYLTRDAEWARQWAPEDPRAKPDQAADLRKMEPAF